MKDRMRWGLVIALACAHMACVAWSEDLVITSFGATGELVFNTLNDGTNYNYRVEWAPSPAGPWSEFGAAGAFWLNTVPAAQGGSATSSVPTCYRVVATAGDYMSIDLSGGTNAASYPVQYYPTLADVPGGPNSDAYKTTNLLMRLIPKGSFIMGSPPGELGHRSDETQHVVTLTKDFYIGVFEVTQRQWELVMGNRPSYAVNEAYYASRPVEQVSYYDVRENPANSALTTNWPNSSHVHADSFMGKLRTKTGMTTFDLPTESQWEYACRSGTRSSVNSGKNVTATQTCPNMAEVSRYRYNGGNDATPNGDTSVGSAKVGTYLPNAYGLYDMHGNVWEWCLDWYGAYPGDVQDPKGAASGLARVIRGGALNSNSAGNRSSYRNSDLHPSWRYANTGFRVARLLP